MIRSAEGGKKLNRILVTGGAGFIGSHLCERLVDMGYETICLDSFERYNNIDGDNPNPDETGNCSVPIEKWNNINSLLSDEKFSLAVGDIRDEAFVDTLLDAAGIDVIIHLAALAGVRPSIERPLEYVDVDVAGTVSLLEQCRKHNIGKFIFASSSSVYGGNSPPFSEVDRVDFQNSPYAASKYCGEIFCKTWSLLFGISSICLRFFTVYGPGQRPDMAICKFTRAVVEGGEVQIFGDGCSLRDYTYIDDIVDGIVASVSYECGQNGHETFNLGNSRPVSILNLIGIIEEKTGKKANLRFMPMQPGDVEVTCADIGKARRLLGYEPKTDISTGVERFVGWFVEKAKKVT